MKNFMPLRYARRPLFARGVHAGLLLAALVVSVPDAAAGPGNLVADGVVGQPDFSHAAPNRVDARGLNEPTAVAIDRSVIPNRLWVFDHGNNRVLGWRNAGDFRAGRRADVVLGQPNAFDYDCASSEFCSGWGWLAVDPEGNLLVSNGGAIRGFLKPFDTDTQADIELDGGGPVAIDPQGTVYAVTLGGVSFWHRPFATDVVPDGVLVALAPENCSLETNSRLASPIVCAPS